MNDPTKEIKQALQTFQDGYIARDSSKLDQFMELFLSGDEPPNPMHVELYLSITMWFARDKMTGKYHHTELKRFQIKWTNSRQAGFLSADWSGEPTHIGSIRVTRFRTS